MPEDYPTSGGGSPRSPTSTRVPPTVILLVGSPDSGKGVVAEYAAVRYGYSVLSAAALLSAEIRRRTEIGRSACPPPSHYYVTLCYIMDSRYAPHSGAPRSPRQLYNFFFLSKVFL